jgi:UDP-2,3-diacylglucosamine pyrophosphatase LpxH
MRVMVQFNDPPGTTDSRNPLFRTGWISDLHLGSRAANAGAALDFLKRNDFEKLYIVGDLIDIWKLKRGRFWPQSHTDVIQQILYKARKGTQVIFIPGNHDDFCQNFLGSFGNIIIKPQDVHVTATGVRLVVMHGHEFDGVTKYAQWLAVIGDMGYSVLFTVNRYFNYLRSCFGLGYWSLSAYIKSKVKNAVNFVSDFEESLVTYAERHNAKGVICGHIHTPAVKKIEWIDYYNCGDWVESGTALVEHTDGRIELIRWLDNTVVVPEEKSRLRLLFRRRSAA